MRLGIMGGTGSAALLDALGGCEHREEGPRVTPFGAASGALRRRERDGHQVLFLPRHGDEGRIAPHAVNYRANLWVFRELARERDLDLLLAVNTVGGIGPGAEPGALVVPDQLIDYTWGRAHTYMGEAGFPLRHVEFTTPFCCRSRERVLAAARRAGLAPVSEGTYGVTQGPRLETAAEIRRLARDGCTVVGMTAMPEAGLARELELPYALCGVVVNYAAGIRPPAGGDPGSLHAQMEVSIRGGMDRVARLIGALLDSA
jgi:5'-methylthioinosine phosphorylase